MSISASQKRELLNDGTPLRPIDVQCGFSADPLFLADVLVDSDAAEALEIIEMRVS